MPSTCSVWPAPGSSSAEPSRESVYVTLDGVEREFTEEDLLICDLEKPVAIAGRHGRADLGGLATTTDVLLESAYFTRTGIIRTARRLDLHSEASHRFERGTDPEGVERAARRCAALIAGWTGARVLTGAARAGGPPERRHVSMRASRATALLGYPVTTSDAAAVFDAPPHDAMRSRRTPSRSRSPGTGSTSNERWI